MKSHAGRGTTGTAAAEVHGHAQVHGHAELSIGELFDAYDFAYILAIHGIVRRAVGKGDKDAHSLVVAGPAGVKENAGAGSVHADRRILKMVVPWLRGTHAQRFGDLGAAVNALLTRLRYGRIGHRSYRRGTIVKPNDCRRGLKRQGNGANLIRKRHGSRQYPEADHGRQDP